MILAAQQIFTNVMLCPTCSQPVINALPGASLFLQYTCTNTKCPDFNALVTVEKSVMTVLSVVRNDPSNK
jgi:hypothetical protein